MKINRFLALLAIVFGLSAAFTNHSAKNSLYPTWKYEKERVAGEKVSFVSAPELADILYEKKEGNTIIDARPLEAYDAYHIPTALHYATGEDPFAAEPGPIKNQKGRTIIVGSAGDDRLFDSYSDLPGKVYFLKGGIEQWYELVLFPDFIKYPVRNSDKLQQIVERCRYFGGTPKNTQLLNIDIRKNSFREGC